MRAEQIAALVALWPALWAVRRFIERSEARRAQREREREAAVSEYAGRFGTREAAAPDDRAAYVLWLASEGLAPYEGELPSATVNDSAYDAAPPYFIGRSRN